MIGMKNYFVDPEGYSQLCWFGWDYAFNSFSVTRVNGTYFQRDDPHWL